MLKIWCIYVFATMLLGFADAIFGFDYGVTGAMLYSGIYVLGGIGLPVWENPPLGLGDWPVPNLFGYVLGISVWLLIFWGMSYLHMRESRDMEKIEQQKRNIKNRRY